VVSREGLEVEAVACQETCEGIVGGGKQSNTVIPAPRSSVSNLHELEMSVICAKKYVSLEWNPEPEDRSQRRG
jgi:hypothetical protein